MSNPSKLQSWLPGGPSDNKLSHQHHTCQYHCDLDDQLENSIGDLCQVTNPQTIGERPRIRDEAIVHIVTLLRRLDENGKRPKRLYWSTRPRIYIVLRAVHALYAMDKFIAQGFTDMDLPFDHQTLPRLLEDDRTRQSFLDEQASVLADNVRDLLQGVHKSLPDASAHFSPLEKLGDGGYGSVDAVYSLLDTKFYARKRIARGPDTDFNRRRQHFLMEEIEHLKKCSHRHLVRIIGSYTDVKCIAYLMEPLAHCNLYHYLTGQGPIELGTIAYKATMRHFFGCLATAVDYLHREKKIRHRDLKPQNVLVDRGGQVYIGDFGAALDYSTTSHSTTRDRDVPTTREYMSPEAARGSKKGPPSDLWSLGLIFLDMVTVLAGRSLSEWKRCLQKRATSSGGFYAYENAASITEWLNLLQDSSLDAPRDMEPLIWTKDLLKERPDARPKSQALVRMIAEGPYSTDFCCVSCREDFNRQSQFDDSPKADLHFLSHSNTASSPDKEMDVEKKKNIDQWRRNVMKHPTELMLDHDTGYIMPGAWPIDITQSSADSELRSPFNLQESMPKGLPLENPDPSSPFEWHESMGVNLSQSKSDYAAEFIPTGELFQPRDPSSSKNSDALLMSSIVASPPVSPPREHLIGRHISPLGSILENVHGEKHQSNEKRLANIKSEHSTTTVGNEARGTEQDRMSVKVHHAGTHSHSKDLPSLPKEHQVRSRTLRNSIAAEKLGKDRGRSTHTVAVIQGPQQERDVERTNLSGSLKARSASSVKSEICTQEEPEPLQCTRPQKTHKDVSSEIRAQGANLSHGAMVIPSSDNVADREVHEIPACCGTRKQINSVDPPPTSEGKKTKASGKQSSNPSRTQVSVQKDYFDAAEYIEAAWRKVEGAKSVSTTLSSQKASRSIFEGPLSSWLNYQFDVVEHFCKDGDPTHVRIWLKERRCNPGTEENPRPKPLLLAIKGGSENHNKCARALLEHGCDANAKFRNRTPIHWLINGPYFKGYEKLLAMLLSAGAKMNTADGKGDYPLLKLLGGPADEPLEEYKTIALALILNKGVPTEVDVNVKQPMSQNTALHLAVQRRASAAVGMLIHHGADVNATTASGTTPLIMAASQWRDTLTSEQSEILQRLLAASEIEIDVVGGSLSRTALHHAMASGCKEAAKLLVERGASLSGCDKDGHDALALLQQSVTPHLKAPRRRILRDILERKL